MNVLLLCICALIFNLFLSLILPSSFSRAPSSSQVHSHRRKHTMKTHDDFSSSFCSIFLIFISFSLSLSL